MKKYETLERMKHYLDNYCYSVDQVEKHEDVKEYIDYLMKKIRAV